MDEFISENIKRIMNKIYASGRNIELVAVTKNFPVEYINKAIDCGITQIGENRVQELLSKYEGIKSREKIKINLIGHLQTNKVKYIIDKVDLIQSLDSIKLAEKINELSAIAGKVMNVLVQLNMGNEDNKYGIAPDETYDFLLKLSNYKNIRVCGLMGVVPKSEKIDENRKYFSQLYNIYLDIKQKKIDNIYMDILSMGMSGDYQVAIECGTGMIRIGSAIFGKRKNK